MSGVSVLQYLQQVSPTVDLGAELAIQSGRMVPGGMFSGEWMMLQIIEKWIRSHLFDPKSHKYY